MEVASSAHARIEVAREKCDVAVQPFLGFQEGEEEEAGHVQEGEIRTVRGAWALERIGEPTHALLEHPIEATREGLAAKELAPSRVHQQVFCCTRRRDESHRFRIAGHDALAACHQRRYPRRAHSGSPAGKSHLGTACRRPNYKPQHVRRVRHQRRG